MNGKILATLLLVTLLFAGGAGAVDDVTPKVKYADATLPNISDALFRKGIIRTDDPAAVEEYIRIHECGLYAQYANDDFAWTRIREAYARELQVRLKDLPDGLEISSALPLGQYDLTTGEFQIGERNVMDNTGIIGVLDAVGGSLNACPNERGPNFVPRVHPLNLGIKLDTPITLKSFPLTRSNADKLIAAMNKRPEPDPDIRRQATLVLRIRLTNADPLTSVPDPMRRTIAGLIDDLRIYDSPARKELLFRRDYQTLREKAQK